MTLSILLPMMLQTTLSPVFASAPVPPADTSLPATSEPLTGAEQGSQYARAESTEIEVSSEKVLCRRRPVTGSLVRTTKECHTRREWARLDEDVRNQAGEYADHGRGGTNGN